MNNLPNRTMQIAAIVAFSLSLLTASDVTKAAHLYCGQTLTSNTQLDADLDCEFSGTHGLIIGANNVTLDLNSFTITGGGGFFGVESDGFDDVKVKNGTIESFEAGVFAKTPLKLELSDLVIKNNTMRGVQIEGGEDVEIQNSSFLAPAVSSCVAGTSAIVFIGVTDLDVDNVDVHGGTTAVQIDCGLCDGSEGPNTGRIRNSTFAESHVGMFIGNTTDLKVSNNHFSNIVSTDCDSGDAITVAPVGLQPRTGIEIEDNFIHDNVNGIVLFGVVAGAEIKGNQVRDNSNFGIGLFEIGVPSTGNLIKNNITSGNVFDLVHNESSFPNTWKNNSCVTKEGDDIPTC